jgi:hypothetical protein
VQAKNSVPQSPSALNLHIENLVLRGFASVNRQQIGRGMERELVRLFQDHGVPRSLASSTAVEVLDGGALKIGSATGHEAIGRELARAIYRALTEQLTPLNPE